MGAWGYKPFQNDWVLDDIGVFNFAEDLVKELEKYLTEQTIYYSGYEFTALLVSTYKHGIKQKFIIDEDKVLSIMKTLDKNVLVQEEKDLFHESSKLWISACSIPLCKRKQLLIKCANKLKDELDDPKTGNEYFEKDKLILSMKHVYTTAMEILNTIDNKPLYIDTAKLSKLMGAYSKPALTKFDEIKEQQKMVIYTYDSNKKEHILKNIHNGNTYTVVEEDLIKLIINDKIYKPDSYICMEHLRQFFEKHNKNILKVRCIEKKYDRRKIIAYVIQDEHDRVNVVTSEALKEAIRNNTVECLNLTLTSDNRLINKQI